MGKVLRGAAQVVLVPAGTLMVLAGCWAVLAGLAHVFPPLWWACGCFSWKGHL